MAKIGTAHIEIKPVLNDEALDLIAERIEAAVRAGVEAGMKAANDRRVTYGDIHIQPHAYGGFLREMEADRRRSGLDGRRRNETDE